MVIKGQNRLFVNSLIQKRYRAKVMELLNKYENGLVKKDSKTDEYKEELNAAFKEYHILRNPKEILDTYMESLGTDYKEQGVNSTVKTLLKRALSYARLVNIQTILMDALEKGVEANVKKAFDKVTLETLDNEKIPMGTDEIISQIVYSLIIDNREDTALMFLDKFGLNEKFISNMVKTFDFDTVKKTMDKANEKSTNFEKFANEYTNISNDLYKEIDEGNNAIRALNKCKKLIAVSAKKWGIDSNAIKEFLAAIDKIKAYIKEKPDVDKSTLVRSSVPDAMAKLSEIELNIWNDINETLGGMEVVCNLADRLVINPDSPVAKDRELLNKKFDELAEYNKKINGSENLPEDE